MNKKQQKTTDLQVVDKTTGLTPIQEQTAILLASGETITAVAEQLKIDRGTIYRWQKLVTYQCFFNRQCEDYRSNLTRGLFGMASMALEAIRDSLVSDNEQIRLKTAMWLTERLDNVKVGATDAVEVVKQECTEEPLELFTPILNNDKFLQRLDELGLLDE